MLRLDWMMRRLLRPLWFLLALAFMLEAWLWDHLGPVVARLIALLPLKALKDLAARGIARLNPYASLILFIIPGLVLLPFKLAGVWLIARGHFIAGALVFFMAKTAGLAVTAFLYGLCHDKLMRIPLFVRVYHWAQIARAWSKKQIEPARRAILALRQKFIRRKNKLIPLVLRWRRKNFRRA